MSNDVDAGSPEPLREGEYARIGPDARAPRELCIEPDYQCYPLWLSDASGLDNPDPASLGLSAPLCERLLRWSDAYDATLNQDDPVRSGFASPEDEETFVRDGRALAADVAREWGDRGPVTYYNVTTLVDEPVTATPA